MDLLPPALKNYLFTPVQVVNPLSGDDGLTGVGLFLGQA